MSRIMIAVLITLAVLLTGCGETEPAGGSGAEVVEDDVASEPAGEEPAEEEPAEEAPADEPEDVEAEDEPTEAAAPPAGTRENPLDLGTSIKMGDWNVSVVDVTKDAADQVMAENQFNEEPAKGRQFVMFKVKAKYVGEDSGDPWLDFSWAIIGAGGNTFGTSSDDSCGVIPKPLDDQGETYPDGRVRGNVCVSVPAKQLKGATIRVEESMSFEGNRAFFAIP